MAMGQKLHSESLSTRLCCKVSGVKPWIFDPETHMPQETWLCGTDLPFQISWPKLLCIPLWNDRSQRFSCSEVCPATLVKMASNIYWGILSMYIYGVGSIPINTIFRGMNIHLPAILMFTRGTRFWPTAILMWPELLVVYLVDQSVCLVHVSGKKWFETTLHH